jgi:hypothetical protein
MLSPAYLGGTSAAQCHPPQPVESRVRSEASQTTGGDRSEPVGQVEPTGRVMHMCSTSIYQMRSLSYIK